MKITVLTFGSQGDVEPFIALGHRLILAGYQVRLVGPETYRSRFTLGTMEYISLPGDPNSLVQELVDQAGTNRFRMVTSMSKFVIPLAVQVFELARSACQDADLIIHSFLMTSTGIGLGEEMGIPTISAQFFPVFSPTSEFPAPTFPDLPLGKFYRSLTHHLVSGTFKWGSCILYQRVRKNHPHLPILRKWIPGDQTPILYGISPTVLSRPVDWKTKTHLTGYWLIDSEMEGSPPQDLIDFLKSGPPPITVALGSTRTERIREIILQIITALDLLNQRGIIITDQLESARHSSSIIQLSYAPYSWVFQRSAAVIHHGGAGTTARGLLAGVPNVIIPFTSDQPFWGRRVYQIGAGPEPIPARKLSESVLIKAIDRAINDQAMRARATRISNQIAMEDGCSQAIRIIEEYLDQS